MRQLNDQLTGRLEASGCFIIQSRILISQKMRSRDVPEVNLWLEIREFPTPDVSEGISSFEDFAGYSTDVDTNCDKCWLSPSIIGPGQQIKPAIIRRVDFIIILARVFDE